MPDTRGVMIFIAYLSILLMNTSARAPTIVAPKIAGSPPMAPAIMIGLMNEKLVPWTQRSPHPAGPTFLHWMKVAIPETKRDIETR